MARRRLAVADAAGLAVLAGGWPALRWAAPSVGYLLFMIPLPFQVEVALAGPLQRFITQASAGVLQIVGLPALPEGNRIYLDREVIEVVTACNGLGMLVSFGALAAALGLKPEQLHPLVREHYRALLESLPAQ